MKVELLRKDPFISIWILRAIWVDILGNAKELLNNSIIIEWFLLEN
jgi:hypothetical protein